MKLDRRCLVLLIFAGVLQLATLRHTTLVTEFVLLLFFFQFTRSLRNASFAKARAVRTAREPRALATPQV